MTQKSSPAQPQFARKAQSYASHAHVQADAANWLAQWLPKKDLDKTCLELGAGTGFLSRELMGRFKDLECSDLSPEMLRECALQAPDIKLSIRDAWQTVSKREDWDYLVSASLLQWSPDPLKNLKNWRQLLRPGGYLTMVFFAKPSLPELESILGGAGPVEWRSPEEWCSIFNRAGYHIRRMENKMRRYDYPCALSFWKSLHGTGASVRRKLKPSQMMRFFRDYEANFSAKRGGIYASWNFCRVILQAPE